MDRQIENITFSQPSDAGGNNNVLSFRLNMHIFQSKHSTSSLVENMIHLERT